MGESETLLDNFKIKNVILNKGNINNLEESLIKKIKVHKINYEISKEELKIDGYRLLFLGNTIYDNENDNSSVIYFKYGLINALLMGDASVRVEEEIIKKYI